MEYTYSYVSDMFTIWNFIGKYRQKTVLCFYLNQCRDGSTISYFWVCSVHNFLIIVSDVYKFWGKCLYDNLKPNYPLRVQKLNFGLTYPTPVLKFSRGPVLVLVKILKLSPVSYSWSYFFWPRRLPPLFPLKLKHYPTLHLNRKLDVI